MHPPVICECPKCRARVYVQDDENSIRRRIRKLELLSSRAPGQTVADGVVKRRKAA